MSAAANRAFLDPTEWRVDAAVTQVATTLCLAVVETVTGDRSLTQLTRWLTPDAYDRLAADIGTRPALGQQRPRLLSVHVSTPAAGVAEVCGRVRSAGRSRALALRLERHRGRWVCTTVQLG